MRWSLSKFDIYTRARPAYRKQLLALGKVADGYFEIEDSKIPGPQPLPIGAPRIEIPNPPCGQAGIISANVPVLSEPRMADLVSNFTGAISEWILAGFPIVTRELALERAETCRACPFWDAKARLGLGKCGSPKCGCTKIKVWLATSKCPEARWTL
jgi:hypothetical protein